jgi:broad specificity phosphatase PhoE
MIYQAAHNIVKTAEGKLGLVLRYIQDDEGGEPDEVILWFADGEESGYIEEASLEKATPSDAGYDALTQYWVGAQAKIAWRKVGAIAKSSARAAEGKLGVIAGLEGDDPCACAKLRFANGESRSISEDSMDQATASDAGYEALLRAQARWILDDPLCKAAREGDVAAIERLAGEGASPDAKDEDGQLSPAVALAAEGGNTTAVEALLRLGADPNAPGRHGRTALMGAANEHAGAVAALLRGGGTVDAVDSSGMTALMLAAYSGHAECARMLLEAGADATLRAMRGGRWEGTTALELAEERAKEEKRWNESDEEFAARQKGYTEVVDLLVERLSPAEKAQWEKTKAEWDRGKAEVAALLRG